jgi:UDP-N-acetylmuramoylalanine--D-glutamate ligase
MSDVDVPITDATTMEEAVEMAYSVGNIGDIILLSPGCPSFDLFKNYEERGNAFRKAVKHL